jgi:AAA+ ATPase superfamily predicted ATPase
MNHPAIDYFPSKLAKAPRFCNRVQERALLKNNINLGRHTVLVSPRRYGKSSLVHQVVLDMEIPCGAIDLFLAHDGKAITKRILDGVGSALSQIMPLSQKALATIQNFFNHFKVVMEASGFGLQFSYDAASFDPVEQIFDSLKSLAKLAESRQEKVLLFLDEFQDIATAENSKSIEGAIRNVAQDTSNLVFVFSGSNRHLLLEPFNDKNKPLYMLCDKLLLDRMSSQDYKPYIQQAARGKWKEPVADNVLNKILALTELHPFYVNLLCNEIWKEKIFPVEANVVRESPPNRTPTLEDVTNAWIACYETEERRLISELEKLTANQQDILKAIAQIPTDEPNGQKFLLTTGLSLSSVRAGVKALLEKDMIYRVKKSDINIPSLKKGQYRVLDPLLAYALRKYS